MDFPMFHLDWLNDRVLIAIIATYRNVNCWNNRYVIHYFLAQKGSEFIKKLFK